MVKTKRNILQKAQILIELLVAMAIATVLISAATSAFVNFGTSDLVNKQYLKAETLAAEAENILRAVGSRSFMELAGVSYPAHPEKQDDVWRLLSGSETIDIYSRQIDSEPVYRDPATGQIADVGNLDPAMRKFRVTVSWSQPISRHYEREFLLAAAGDETRFQDTNEADFNAGLPIDTLVTDTQGGEVTLNFGGTGGGHVGPLFSIVGTEGLGNMNGAAKKASFRFTSRETKKVNRIYLYTQSHNDAPAYRVGLQSDDNGNPSGQWLGATGQAYAIYNPVFWFTGWFSVDLRESADLVFDGIYHIVVEYDSGQIVPGKYINLLVLNPLNQVWPYDNAEASALNSLWSDNDGASWTEKNKQPVFVLRYADNTYQGFPYDYIWEGYVDRVTYQAEHFTQTEETQEIDTVSLWVRRNVSSQPDDHLYAVLDDLTTGERLIDNIILAHKETTTRTYQYVTVTLPESVLLTQDHEYRFWVNSPGTSWTRSYRVAIASNWPDDMLTSLNYQGASAYREFNLDLTGWGWQEVLWQDLLFQFQALAETGYMDAGTFESRIFDAGSAVLFNRISWIADIPAGTNLQFQVAISDNPDSFNYFGPDGTADTYYPAGDGSGEVPYTLSAGRYFRYRAEFFTTDSSVTPTVYDFNVFYNR